MVTFAAVAMVLVVSQARKEEVPKLTKAEQIQIDKIAYYLKDLSPKRRSYALTELAKLGPKAGVKAPEIANLLLSDPDPTVRQSAIGTLEKMGPSVASQVLPQILAAASSSKDDKVRTVAVEVVAKLAEKSGDNGDALASIMKTDKDARIRKRAAAALEKVNAKKAVDLPKHVRALQQDPSTPKRVEAAKAIQELGPAAKSALAVLVTKLRGDEPAEVRAAVAHAIGAIGPDAESAVPVLTAIALEDKEAVVRAAAIDALVALGETGALGKSKLVREGIETPKETKADEKKAKEKPDAKTAKANG